MTIAVNAPGRLHDWIVQQLADVPPAGPAEAAAVTRTFRDTLGVALAGAGQRSTAWARAYAQHTGRDGPASVWGTSHRLDRSTAALAPRHACRASARLIAGKVPSVMRRCLPFAR